MVKIIFENKEHEIRYNNILDRMIYSDNLHKSVAYLLALIGDYENDVFDFEKNRIKPESLKAAWQTSNTARATALIFALWNGYNNDSNCGNVYNIFRYNYWDKYYIEALKIYCSDSLNFPAVNLKI